MKHDYTDEEIKTAWKDSLSLRAFLDALPERPQSAEIASLKAALAESEKQFQAKVDEIARLLDERNKAQAELAALRQPILADDGRSLGQVLHEILDEGLSWDRLLKGDKEQCKLAAQAVVSAARPAIEAEFLAQVVRRMEAVPVTEMWNMWGRAKSLTGIRARLIAAANGEGQAVVVNEPPKSEGQPDLSGESEKQAQPWTPAVGDVVRLKSGGPAMTVTHVDPLSLMCAWMNANNELQVEPITNLCLTPVPTP